MFYSTRKEDLLVRNLGFVIYSDFLFLRGGGFSWKPQKNSIFWEEKLMGLHELQSFFIPMQWKGHEKERSNFNNLAAH
jgi:hypothetical protein